MEGGVLWCSGQVKCSPDGKSFHFKLCMNSVGDASTAEGNVQKGLKEFLMRSGKPDRKTGDISNACAKSKVGRKGTQMLVGSSEWVAYGCFKIF